MIANALFALAVQADTAAVTLPFRPPERTSVVERIVQRRVVNDVAVRFTIWREHRFDPLPDGGWRLTMRVVAAHTDARGAIATGFRLGSEPLIGLPLIATLDANGRLRSIDNGGVYWRAFATGQRRLAAEVGDRPDLGETDRRVVAAVVAGLIDEPADARDARLAADIEPIVAHGGRTFVVGQPIPFDADARSAGDLTLEAVDDRSARLSLRSQTPTDALASVSVDASIAVDRATGLSTRRDERRSIRQGDARLDIVETRRLAPCGISIPVGKAADSLDLIACFDDSPAIAPPTHGRRFQFEGQSGHEGADENHQVGQADRGGQEMGADRRRRAGGRPAGVDRRQSAARQA